MQQESTARASGGGQAGVSRRVLARGAAWAVPAVTIAAAAPALAASPPPPGLQGWLGVGKTCVSGTDTLTIDGRGSFPTRGLWVYYTTSTTVLTGARMTFYYPTSLGTLTWSDSINGWSKPVVTTGVDPVMPGYTAYTTYYTGGWTWVNATGTDPDYTLANGDPYFTASVTLSDAVCRAGGLTMYIQRTVTVTDGGDSETISFLRGPTIM